MRTVGLRVVVDVAVRDVVAVLNAVEAVVDVVMVDRQSACRRYDGGLPSSRGRPSRQWRRNRGSWCTQRRRAAAANVVHDRVELSTLTAALTRLFSTVMLFASRSISPVTFIAFTTAPLVLTTMSPGVRESDDCRTGNLPTFPVAGSGTRMIPVTRSS